MKQALLIIEDDPFISELLTKELINSGFTVHYSADAEGGIEILKTRIPDIILLDILLPGMNGFEFLEKIKAEERTKAIPVVILSNLGSEDDIKKGKGLGADAYLVKANFIMEDVVKKIEEVLQKKKTGHSKVEHA